MTKLRNIYSVQILIMLIISFCLNFGLVAFAEEVTLNDLGCLRTNSDWCLYHNERFGLSIEIPTRGFKYRVPDNGDGVGLTSMDNSTNISIYSNFIYTNDMNLDENPNVAKKINRLFKQSIDDKIERGWIISYQIIKEDFFVISGTFGQNTFYERRTVSSECPEIAAAVSIQYPSSRKRNLDSIVTQLSRSLRSTCKNIYN